MAYLQARFEEKCNTTGAPTELSFFTTTFLIILLILNIPGNLLLILAVAIDPYENLRNPFNNLMINLAVADLLAGIVTGPLATSFAMKEGLNEKISTAEIRTLHMFFFISCTASTLSLASLSVERYLAICSPHTYRRKITRKRILGTVVGIWFISLTLPFVYFEVGFITSAFILLNTTVLVAIAITCFTYGFMIYKFNRCTEGNKKATTKDDRRRNEGQEDATTKDDERHKFSHVDATTKDDDRCTNSHVNSTMNNDNQCTQGHKDTTMNQDRHGKNRPGTRSRDRTIAQDKAVHWERKITKMFLVVTVALLCCYGPATILIYVTSFCESCSCTVLHWFRDLQILFMLMNSSVNFFCYGLRSPRFQRAFARILRIQGHQRMPASTSSTTPTQASATAL